MTLAQDTLKQAQAALKDKDSEIATIRKEDDSRIASLEKSVAADQSQLASAQTLVDAAQSSSRVSKATETSQLGQLQQQLSDWQGRKADLDLQLASAKRDIAARDQQIANEHAQLEALQRDDARKVAALQASDKISQADSADSPLNLQLASARRDITDRDQRLAQAQTTIAALKSQLAQNQARAETGMPDSVMAAAASVQPQAGGTDRVKTPTVSFAPREMSFAVPSIMPAKASFDSPASFATLLSDAGVKLTKGVHGVSAATNGDKMAMAWQAGPVYGSVEQTRVPTASSFSDLVQRYLDRSRTRCKGQFAVVPGKTRTGGSISTASRRYRLRCPEGRARRRRIAVILRKDGVFTAVAHETGMDNMDDAMDIATA